MTLHHAWQMERDGLLSQIKRCAFAGEKADYLKILLTELIEHEPEIPLLPTLYFEDNTGSTSCSLGKWLAKFLALERRGRHCTRQPQHAI